MNAETKERFYCPRDVSRCARVPSARALATVALLMLMWVKLVTMVAKILISEASMWTQKDQIGSNSWN